MLQNQSCCCPPPLDVQRRPFLGVDRGSLTLSIPLRRRWPHRTLQRRQHGQRSHQANHLIEHRMVQLGPRSATSARHRHYKQTCERSVLAQSRSIAIRWANLGVGNGMCPRQQNPTKEQLQAFGTYNKVQKLCWLVQFMLLQKLHAIFDRALISPRAIQLIWGDLTYVVVKCWNRWGRRGPTEHVGKTERKGGKLEEDCPCPIWRRQLDMIALVRSWEVLQCWKKGDWWLADLTDWSNDNTTGDKAEWKGGTW